MKRKRIIAVLSIAVLGTGIAVYSKGSAEVGDVQAAGTIEARTVKLGSKTGGRVKSVRVKEGDQIKAGDVLIEFDDYELAAALQQARGRVQYARANERKLAAGSRPEEIAEARAITNQASAEVARLQAGYTSEQIAQAQAEVTRSEADADSAQIAFDRAERLSRQDILPLRDRDEADARLKMARARLQNARERLAELRRGYRVEEINAAQARYQQANAVLNRLLNGTRPEDRDMAGGDLTRAEGELREIEARYRERQIVAPSDARVEVLDVRPGDLISPNATVVTLLERDQVYARVFVSETVIGHVHVGKKAVVQLDSFPGRQFEAEVTQMNDKAEFLPRSVQTFDDRVHQFFALKLRIEDPDRLVRPGMAIEAKFTRHGAHNARNSD
jgi:multidrug resistance efflux pump